jgi:CheY-like chemotaxis protein
MTAVAGTRALDVETRFDGTNIAIDITDTGPGIPEDVRKRVFEPFFTTKPQGVGTGIGLSVCLRIVQAHGGTIFLDNAEGGGTICRIRLPVTEARTITAPGAGESPFTLSGELLVVDDEPAIGRYVSEYLTSEGVVVTAVDSGREAVELLANGTRFDAVLTDLRMPDISGDKLIAFIAENRPDLADRVVVMTGDALGAEVNTSARDVPVVVKPLELRTLRTALRPMLGRDVERGDKISGREAGVDQKENA